MRIFLAGASGVIGRLLIPRLLERGHSVVGATRSADKAGPLKLLGAEPVVVNVFDRAGLMAAVTAAAPQLVMHQLTDLPDALEASKMEEYLPLNARIRREGTRNLVDAAVAARCTRVIAQSIAWIYAPGPEPHKEEDPLAAGADGSFGITVQGVAALEEAVLHTASINGVVLRYGAFYGEGTGASGPHAQLPSVSVAAAAHAAVLAADRPVRGIFNIAEANRWISTAKAATQLGWRAADSPM
jgi:nucleoside-diphosphate-sugar epimerase